MKNKHKLFINMAELVSGQSTCCRLSVGAVLVKDNRVISIGFNGVPSGHKHCEEHFEEVCRSAGTSKEEYFKSREFMDDHGKFSNENELHAEQNAILFAAKNGIATAGATLYITQAARLLGSSGAGWNVPDQLSAQLVALKKLTTGGTAFDSIAALMANKLGSTDALMKFYGGQVSDKDVLTELTFSSPNSLTFTTNESSFNVLGGSDPNYPLTMNGQTVQRSSAGFFSLTLTLT